MLNNAVPAHFIDVPFARYHAPGKSMFSSCTSILIVTLDILYHEHCCPCAACLHLLIRACTLLYVKATVPLWVSSNWHRLLPFIDFATTFENFSNLLGFFPSCQWAMF